MNYQRSSTSFAGRLSIWLAAVLILAPIADVLFGVLPFRFGQIRYRVATVGLLSGAMLLPMLGFYLALNSAHSQDRRGLSRLLATCCALIGVALLLFGGLFAIDVLQLRQSITVGTRRAYDLAALKSFVTQIAEAVVFLVFAITSFRMGRAGARGDSEHRRRSQSASTIVGATAVRPSRPLQTRESATDQRNVADDEL